MKAFVGVTDEEWFDLLASRGVDEANFWQPGGSRLFKALQPGELFLFKLHAPNNFIAGGGFFAHSSLLPLSLAWDAFGIANGATTLSEMRTRAETYRRSPANEVANYTIGCIVLEQTFFWRRENWIPVPADWKPNIVQGRSYDLTAEPGRSLWLGVQSRLEGSLVAPKGAAQAARFGDPILIRPRLGQGGFRVLVTDAYQRRCSITGEKTLPVLEAAHIKGFASGGEHSVSNGLLLRSDLHSLYDRGYITVTRDHRVEVSRRIKEEFSNGRTYYALDGNKIELPGRAEDRPDAAMLQWHAENVYEKVYRG